MAGMFPGTDSLKIAQTAFPQCEYTQFFCMGHVSFLRTGHLQFQMLDMKQKCLDLKWMHIAFQWFLPHKIMSAHRNIPGYSRGKRSSRVVPVYVFGGPGIMSEHCTPGQIEKRIAAGTVADKQIAGRT